MMDFGLWQVFVVDPGVGLPFADASSEVKYIHDKAIYHSWHRHRTLRYGIAGKNSQSTAGYGMFVRRAAIAVVEDGRHDVGGSLAANGRVEYRARRQHALTPSPSPASGRGEFFLITRLSKRARGDFSDGTVEQVREGKVE